MLYYIVIEIYKKTLNIILNKYNITIIPIYSDELLHFNYINNFLNYNFANKTGPKISDRLWKPYMKDNPDNTIYKLLKKL